MKINRKALLACTALVALAGIAVAQTISVPTTSTIGTSDIFPIVKNGTPQANSQFATLARMRSGIISGSGDHTGTPAMTGCVTSGGAILGTDFAFILTEGSSANTSCVATFATHFNALPACIVTGQNGAATTLMSYAVSTTAVTITQASLTGQVYDVICAGQAGG